MGIHAKMAAAQREIGGMRRRGKAKVELKAGGSYTYEYLTESQLMDAIKKKLAAVEVATYVSVERQWEDGGATRVEVLVTFADGETGETFAVKGQGAGTDYGDKGVYKAITGAVRYVLWKTFLVPSDKDDPDTSHTNRRDHGKQAADDDKALAKLATMRDRIDKLADELDALQKGDPGAWHDQVVLVHGPLAEVTDEALLAKIGVALRDKLAREKERIRELGPEYAPDRTLDL